jgi:4-diphosphocytidyl-2-C-methyl-D-erythritol kinase
MKMIMQDVDLYDNITLEVKNTDQICIITNMVYLPTDERNLANKAVRLFYDYTGLDFLGLDIRIDKKIPVSAGLAGGSTNAAGVLKGLNLLHDTKIPIEKLCELGKQIGADVPYCILGGTALAEGIGEILTPQKSLPIVILL